jgi:hypothetical protein
MVITRVRPKYGMQEKLAVTWCCPFRAQYKVSRENHESNRLNRVQGQVAKMLLCIHHHTLSDVVRGEMGSMCIRCPLGSEFVCTISCTLCIFMHHSTACPCDLKILLNSPGFQGIPESRSQISIVYDVHDTGTSHGGGASHFMQHYVNSMHARTLYA